MLHYQMHGTPHQPPLCLLHGFMGRSGDWVPIVDALDREAYIVTVDLPGHGRSLDRPSHVYTMEGATQALADVLDDAGVRRCSLVGYSMGGRIALYFALFHPDRVQRLVLESASPGLRTEGGRQHRREIDAGRAERIEENLDAFLQNWYRQPLFASLDRHGLVEEMIETRRDNDPEELARALRGLGTGRQPSLWEKLSRLSVPTLLMTGALDDKYVRITKEAARSVDQGRRVVVEGAGHNVHAERPQAYLAHLVRFLNDT